MADTIMNKVAILNLTYLNTVHSQVQPLKILKRLKVS